MSDKPNNPAVYPLPHTQDAGMTLLDKFAGDALAALCSLEFTMAYVTLVEEEGGDLEEKIASDAYKQAEAMLKEREKRGIQ